MIVRELVDRLLAMDQTLEIVVSRDEEGNGFRPLYAVMQSYLDHEGVPIHPDDFDNYDNPERAVVLWP